MLTLIISLVALALSAFATFESIRAKKAKNDAQTVVETPTPTPQIVEQYVHVESDFFEVKDGSVHLKDEYNGLYVDGFISAGGQSKTKED